MPRNRRRRAPPAARPDQSSHGRRRRRLCSHESLASASLVQLPVDATAATLWEQAVAPRVPATIAAGSPLWASVQDLGNPELLMARCGDVKVDVEWRGAQDPEEGFGEGRRRRGVPFRQVVTRAAVDGDSRYYMTAQRTRPQQIVGDPLENWPNLPLRPPLAGALVPQAINLWLGFASAGIGTTTGLHHDYHDNFYIVLRGEKRFSLYPPEAVDDDLLDVAGTVERRWPNGRIVYRDPDTVVRRSDGMDAVTEARMRCRVLEKAAELFPERQEDLEERALDASMALYELVGDEEHGEEGESGASVNLRSADDDDDKEEYQYGEGELPPHFVRPGRRRPKPSMSVTLRPGMVLYLPAGWFHEVHSAGGLHIALNYWFHPPDGGRGTLKHPYGPLWDDQLWEHAVRFLGVSPPPGPGPDSLVWP